MIRLRRLLERCRAHPVAGPIALVLLVLVLAMVFVHAAEDGHEVATELGAVCLGVVSFVWLVVAERLRRRPASPAIAVRRDRGPPLRDATIAGSLPAAISSPSFPLRR